MHVEETQTIQLMAFFRSSSYQVTHQKKIRPFTAQTANHWPSHLQETADYFLAHFSLFIPWGFKTPQWSRDQGSIPLLEKGELSEKGSILGKQEQSTF